MLPTFTVSVSRSQRSYDFNLNDRGIGESGIDGTNLLPEPAVAFQAGNAIRAMHEAIMATPYQTCAVCFHQVPIMAKGTKLMIEFS